MAVEVLVSGIDGFGSTLWQFRTPWFDWHELHNKLPFHQEDHLTWTCRISRAEAYRLMEGVEPYLEWQQERAAALRRNIWAATTREVELRLEEW